MLRLACNLYEAWQMYNHGKIKDWPPWVDTLTRWNHVLLALNSSINIVIYAAKVGCPPRIDNRTKNVNCLCPTLFLLTNNLFGYPIKDLNLIHSFFEIGFQVSTSACKLVDVQTAVKFSSKTRTQISE